MKLSRWKFEMPRVFRLLCLGLVTTGLASCAHVNSEAIHDPFLTETPLATEETLTTNETVPSGSAHAITGIPLPLESELAQVVANPLEVRQVASQSPPKLQQTAAINQPLSTPSIIPESIIPEGETICPPGAIPSAQELCPPCYPGTGYRGMGYPGMGTEMLMGTCPPVVPAWFGGAAIAPIPKHYPDEYLCDGGDREYPVRYSENLRLGLDTEDTVAEYTDHTGESHVKPSNKVCVYAPRFGAMRSISTPITNTGTNATFIEEKFQRGAGVRNRDVAGIHNQNLTVGRYHMGERVSGLDVDSIPSAVGRFQGLASHIKLVNTFEDLQFIRAGLLADTDEVRLAKGLQAASTWTRTQFPVIAATTEQAQEVIGEFQPQQFVRTEDKRKPGRLRIVKLADKKTAQPGDVVTFTIRYDNLGERELYKVRIIDNLTPRLQYVEDSETSDRAGKLLLQDNEEGSVILEFVLDDPLPGGQGGVVTFQTKVR